MAHQRFDEPQGGEVCSHSQTQKEGSMIAWYCAKKCTFINHKKVTRWCKKQDSKRGCKNLRIRRPWWKRNWLTERSLTSALWLVLNVAVPNAVTERVATPTTAWTVGTSTRRLKENSMVMLRKVVTHYQENGFSETRLIPLKWPEMAQAPHFATGLSLPRLSHSCERNHLLVGFIEILW